jgi:ATP-binding cassette subfamily B protein
VALARAFLADAPILVLDEATSALDSESEALIQDAMAALLAGRTALVIAHRLSTVRAMDRILVFDRGRVVEEGDHARLLECGGIYAALFRRQAMGLIDAG